MQHLQAAGSAVEHGTTVTYISSIYHFHLHDDVQIVNFLGVDMQRDVLRIDLKIVLPRNRRICSGIGGTSKYLKFGEGGVEEREQGRVLYDEYSVPR